MNGFARLCLLLLALSGATFELRAAERDDAAIHEVIESFRTSIIQRDKPRFLSLFLQETAPWQMVFSDDGLAQARRRNPGAVKARFKADNNPTKFIDGIVASRNTSEETFSNIRIDSDGDVASVSFDYSFLSNGRKTNWGKELWLLVRTEGGWKITTVAYSVVLPASGADT